MKHNGNFDVLGNVSVLGHYLNLKPEKLEVEPDVGDLTDARLWVHQNALRFFTGTEIITLGVGLTEAQVNTKLGDYLKTADLPAALTDYAKKTEVTAEIGTAVANLVSSTALADALEDYSTSTETTAEIGAAVQNLVSSTAMQNAIDNALSGLDYQADVLGTEADFTTVGGRYIYVDGSKFNGDASVGDIVVVAAGTGDIESVAYDVSTAGPGALVWNRTANAENPNGYWMRWDGTEWAQFGGLANIQTDDSLQKSANTIGLKIDGNSLVVSANGVKIGDLSATYATVTALQTAIADFVTETQVGQQISTALADYSTTTQVENLISAAVDGLATEESVTALETRFNGSFYTVTTPGDVTTLEVTHNIGFRFPQVQIVEYATNELITAGSVKFDTANKLTITLGVAARIIVMVSWAKAVA